MSYRPFQKQKKARRKSRSLPDGEIIKESLTSLNSLLFERKLHCDWFPAVKSQLQTFQRVAHKNNLGQTPKQTKDKNIWSQLLWILISMVIFSDSISSVLGYSPVCPPCDNEMKTDVILEHMCASEFGKNISTYITHAYTPEKRTFILFCTHILNVPRLQPIFPSHLLYSGNGVGMQEIQD